MEGNLAENTWAPYFGARRSLRYYKSSEKVGEEVVESNQSAVGSHEVVDKVVDGERNTNMSPSQVWSPYYGARRSLRRYENFKTTDTQHEDAVGTEKSITSSVVSTIPYPDKLPTAGHFRRANSLPAVIMKAKKTTPGPVGFLFNIISTTDDVQGCNNNNNNNNNKGCKKGAVEFSTTSFAEGVDAMAVLSKCVDNPAFVPDDQCAMQCHHSTDPQRHRDLSEYEVTAKILKTEHESNSKVEADEKPSDIKTDVGGRKQETKSKNIIKVNKLADIRPTKVNRVVKRDTKSSLSRSSSVEAKIAKPRNPVSVPGVCCGVLEYPYAYITHNITHISNMTK